MKYLKQIVLLLTLIEWSRGSQVKLDQMDSAFLASISSRAGYAADAAHSTPIKQARNLVYHKHYVYIGALNWLLKVNAETLKIEQSVRYGPLYDSAFCRYSPVAECMPGHTKALTDNHNKLLVVHAQQNAVLSCWSGRQGICDLRDLDDLSRLLVNSSAAAVANDPVNSTVGFIASSANSQPLLYIATTYNNKGAYRTDVPAVSGRSLKPVPAHFMRIVGSGSHGLKSSKASIEFMSRFKQTFIVKYVHAFNLGIFNYFVTVQHADTDAMLRADRLVSKVARLCLNDLSFTKSYTEMALKCVGASTAVDYNELVSAKHAQLDGDHYLIGLFQHTARNSFNSSMRPGTGQAVCLYKMSDVQRQFGHNINKCYSSEVMRGLNFIKPDQKCMTQRQVAEHVDDQFCSSADNGLYPIGGTVPLVSSAVLEFGDGGYDSVAVFEHELANSIILKSDGRALLDLYDMNTMKVYRSVKVDYGGQLVSELVASDVSVDATGGAVYALSGNHLVKIDMLDCGRLTSCAQCVAESMRAQIYCGWCAASGRCSARAHCDNGANGANGAKWLSAASLNASEMESSSAAAVCVDIESVQPRLIHVDSAHQHWIHVRFGNEMSVRAEHNYSCVFATARQLETRAVWMDSSELKCPVPHVSQVEELLFIEAGQRGAKMELADDGIFGVVRPTVNRRELGVYVKNWQGFRYGWSKLRSAALFNITVVNCGMYRSCISCASDECLWCGNKCVPAEEQTNSQCVNGTHECSSFDPATNKLLIPYTAHRPQAPLTFTLNNIASIATATSSFVCHLTMGDGALLPRPIAMPFTVLNKTHSSCALTHIFASLEPLLTNGQVQTDLRVYTGDHYIDSPSNGKLSLLFYKCEEKAADCSSCLSVNRQLSCMWCGVGSCRFMNAQSKLAALSECIGAWSNSALVPVNQCQKPHIESIGPVKVPYSGGSLLTINGANLGSSFDDVISVTLACAATATTHCDPIRAKYTVSKQIVCKLGAFANSNDECWVNVRLKSSVVVAGSAHLTNGQQSVLVRASQRVRTVDPVITSVQPAQVIQSAGFVWLTITGVDLDSGRFRQLNIVDDVSDFRQRVVKCLIKNVTEHTVRCRLSDKFSSLGKKNLRLIIDEYTTINAHLKVNSDPLVKSIDHWTSFYSGGASFQLAGFNFDSVQSAYTFVNYGGMWYSEPVSATRRLSNEKMVFETPALTDAFFAIAKSTSVHSHHYKLQVGFLMDGFNVTLSEQHISYVPDLQPASLQALSLHLLKSNDLYTIELTVAMATKSRTSTIVTDAQLVDLVKRDFQVYIGCSLCEQGEWIDNEHYTCTLPQLVHNGSRDYPCQPKVYRALLDQLSSHGSLRMLNMFVGNSWFEMDRGDGDTNIDLYTQSYQLNSVHNFMLVVERLAREQSVSGSEAASVVDRILHKYAQFRRESSKSALITPGLMSNKNLLVLSGIIASIVLILILVTLSLGSVVLRLKHKRTPVYKLGCRRRRHGRLHLELIQKQMHQLELTIRPQCSHLYQQLHNDYLNELNNDLVYSLTALPLYNYKTYLYSCIFARPHKLDLIYSPLNLVMSSSSMSNSTTNTLLSHTHTPVPKPNMSVYATIKSSAMLHSADQDTSTTTTTNTNTNTNTSKQQHFGSYGPIGEAMLLFDQLMHNKTFVSTFVEVCESHKDTFGLKEKHNFSALITLALKDNLHYLYSIIKSLLADHIADCVSSKRSILASGDTLVQPLVNNFVAMFMYDYQRDSQTAVHLYRLVASISSFVKMAPCDQLKHLSVHSLNEHTLLSDALIASYQTLYVNVVLDTAVVANSKNLYLVPLVDTDTVLQAKQKIIDCVFKRANMCSFNLERAPTTHDLDLELCLILIQAGSVADSNQTTLITLRETEDQLVSSSHRTPLSKRLLTLKDYNIQNGSFINLNLKPSVIAQNKDKDNHVYMSTMSMNNNEYVLYATKPHSHTQSHSHSHSHTQSHSHSHTDYYHLVKPGDQYTHTSCNASSPPVTANSKKRQKYEKLLSVKSQEASSMHTDSLIKHDNVLSHLSRLLVNKSVIQPFVDQLVECILANRTSLPPVITNLLAFIDSEVAKCSLKSDEAKKIAHRSKVNVYFVRYWLNVIRNPELIVACERSPLLDSSLSCVAQALLDSCSWPDAHTECECDASSALNRLLFVRELPKYKQMIEAFFDEVQSVPATSDHEIHFYLSEFSKCKNAQMQSEAMGGTLNTNSSEAGHAELNSVQVLLQLYEYYEKYQHQINAALGQQQCSVLLPVHHRLVQIRDLMSMSSMANNQTMNRSGAGSGGASNPYQQISASYQPVNCYAATSDLIVSYPTMNTSVQPLNTLPHLRNQHFQPIHQQQFF